MSCILLLFNNYYPQNNFRIKRAISQGEISRELEP